MAYGSEQYDDEEQTTDDDMEMGPYRTPAEMGPSDPEDVHFAMLGDDEIAAELLERVQDYYQHLEQQGIGELWNASYRAYYGLDEDGTYHKSSAVSFGGTGGELSLVKVNHYRSIARHLLTLTTTNRPHFEARAINTDLKSLAQTDIARGVLDYYLREQRIEHKLKSCVEKGIVFGEGYLSITWDATAGDVGPTDEIDPETGQPKMERVGDLDVRTFTPLDVIRDWRRDPTEQDWYILRSFKNKYDLAAQFPEMADDILALTREDGEGQNTVNRSRIGTKLGDSETDDVAYFEFYHRPTDAVPEGRHVIFLDGDILLFAGPLPYDELPVYRMSPGDFMGSSYGYSDAWDLLSLQQIVDSMASVMLSNYDAHGVQNVVMEQGSEVDPQALVGGMRIWKIPRQAQPPAGINLTKMPEGIADFMQMIIGYMETLSGVNSVARGNPGETLGKGVSGSALALVQSLAIQYNSGLQQGYATLLEDGGTGILNVLKRYADRPRVAMIAGKDDRYMLREFSAQDIAQVSRVVVDPGNPMLRTNEGRWELVQLLMDFQNQTGTKVFDSGEQIVTVLNTGQVEVLYKGTQSELMLIRRENELMAEGPKVQMAEVMDPKTGEPVPLQQVDGVPVTILDAHMLHIREHKAVIASPEARSNPKVVQAVTAHILEHMFHLRAADPYLLKIIGEEPIVQGDPMAPGGDLPAGPAPGGGGGAPPEMAEIDAMQGNPQAKQPEMPVNPMTGEPAQVGGGAM